jgi:hypothetical protein
MENSVQNQEIVKGTTVKYNGGYYTVTRVTKNTVNLGSIFGNHIYHKGVAKSEVVETRRVVCILVKV